VFEGAAPAETGIEPGAEQYGVDVQPDSLITSTIPGTIPGDPRTSVRRLY
jgi:hypothetical protein